MVVVVVVRVRGREEKGFVLKLTSSVKTEGREGRIEFVCTGHVEIDWVGR